MFQINSPKEKYQNNNFVKDKVLIVCITDKYIEDKCYESIINQDYNDYSTLIHIQKYKKLSDNYIEDKYKNCSRNREIARKLALNSDAQYFLFIDSDIELPKNTISKLISNKIPVVGGWYKMQNTNNWVAGRWVGDNEFFNLKCVDPYLSSVDMAGLGCLMIRRDVLEQIEFKDGVDLFAQNEEGNTITVGECGVLGNDIFDLGYKICMDGDVVCNHLNRLKQNNL